MNKRTYSNYVFNDEEHQNCLNRKKAEKMCKNKLKNISSGNSQLYLKVLVLNTMKYVLNSDHVTFDEDLEYEPVEKKKCNSSSTKDIFEILDEMTFLQPLLLPPDDFY